jgi:hypothetical protein
MVSPIVDPHGCPTLSGGTTPFARSAAVVPCGTVVAGAVLAVVVGSRSGSVVTVWKVDVGASGSTGTTSAPATQALAIIATAATSTVRRGMARECRNRRFFRPASDTPIGRR